MADYNNPTMTPLLVSASVPEMERLREVSEELNEPLDTMIVRLALLAIEYYEMAQEKRSIVKVTRSLLEQNKAMGEALGFVEVWMKAEINCTGTRSEREAMANLAIAAIIRSQAAFKGGVQ